MVFCNKVLNNTECSIELGHNPYFNRWFSAIEQQVSTKEDKSGHNPYFNRWFSAITRSIRNTKSIRCHNPYFNRWFSAI